MTYFNLHFSSYYLLCVVKINRQKPHLKWSHRPHSRYTTDTNRKKCSLHFRQEMVLDYLSKRKKKFLHAQEQFRQREMANTQPIKSHYASNFQFPPMDSSFTTAPPKSIRECSSSLVLQTYAWFGIKPHIPNCNPLLFPNKHILLEKYLAAYLFKANVSFSTLSFNFAPNKSIFRRKGVWERIRKREFGERGRYYHF